MKKIYFGLLLLILSSAAAGQTKQLHFKKEIPELSLLRLTASVGEVRITTCRCDVVTASVEIKPSDSWFTLDLDDVQLRARTESGELRLSVDHDNVAQQWQITLPESSSVDIDLAVGEVSLSQFSSNANITIDVGQARVNLSSDDYANVSLHSTVGETRVSGLSDSENKRTLLSSRSYAHGQGNKQVNIKVNVGEATVTY